MEIKFCKPTIGASEIKSVVQVMSTGWLAAGAKTKQFEEEFAKYVGVKYAIFTNSGTSALKMAYKYMKEQGITEVMMPRNTFCATYSAAEETGIKVYHSYNGSFPGEFVQFWYGGVKNNDSFCYLEDSAHRIEANDPLIGKIRIYSFYVTKNLTTGAGGMFVTDDVDIYNTARLWWMDGIDKSSFDRQNGGWDYQVKAYAGGYDGNDLAATIGLEQLKKLPEMTQLRNQIKDKYNQAFNQDWQGNHLYPYFVKKEEDVGRLIDHLKKDGIQASYHYPGTGWKGVSLPIYPLLTRKEQDYIISSVRRFK